MTSSPTPWEDEIAASEEFWSDLFSPQPGEARSQSPEWLRIARKLPVTYRRSQGLMKRPILGVVLHTTNHGAGAETLERFQRDWQAAQSQTTHFMVDRQGHIGQFRSTSQRANHIKARVRWDNRYFGIEHIAKHKQPLTARQLERSARLIGDLAVLFDFPARALAARGRPGIGIHIDFAMTGCGQNVFWSGPDRGRTETYSRLVERAHDFATVGF